jgi:prepilin-type N-terminal cleavage/methylation domain-containing protein
VSARAGFTLIELLVVIAILSLMMGLSSMAFLRADSPRGPDLPGQLLALRREAIRAGHPRTRTLRRGDTVYVVTMLADGRAIADPTLHLDPSTGGAADATR